MEDKLHMQKERLIECVKSREFLYDRKNPLYMDVKYKSIAWREIAEELNQPVAVCRNNWQDIRSSFGTSSDRRPHRYEGKLQFLTPFFTERESMSSLEDSMGESSKAPNGPPTSTSPPNNNDNAAKQSNGTGNREKSSSQKRKRWDLEEEGVAENWENRLTACTELIDKVVQGRTQTPWNTPLGLFFEGALVNVSRLKRRNQTKVQQKILQLISEMQDAEDEENTFNTIKLD
ncbi:uncharacterized protein LOC143208413 [Lasioglossum baleicum]|uniref:uncharacterized protein LOC143208413 n=1 Tax=Lasioglossum baleicum TaxID=434251 RepID=UPI003FCE5B66